MTSYPLCPSLYQRLRQRFPSGVLIQAQGEPMAATMRRDPMLRRDVPNITSWGEYYCVDCPACGESRKRLLICHRWLEFDFACKCLNETHCFSGEKKRRNLPLLRERVLGSGPELDRAVMAKPVAAEEPLRPTGLPGEIRSLRQLPADHAALRYLTGPKRRFDVEQLAACFDVGFCYYSPRYSTMNGRIYVPVYLAGQLVGWQGRCPEDLDWKATGVPKYFNMPGTWRRRVLYNFDLACRSRVVVFCEGVTDVWSLGWRAVASLGSELSGPQIELVQRNWRDGLVVLYFDNNDPPERWGESQRNAAAVVHKLAAAMVGTKCQIVSACPPPGYDPGGLGTTLNWQIVGEAVRQAGLNLMDYWNSA